QHFVDGFALSDKSGRFGEPLSVEYPPDGEVQLVGRDGLGEDVGEAEGAESIAEIWIIDVGKADHRRATPQLIPHNLRVAGITEVAGENNEIGLEAFDLAAEVVEWRDHCGLDGVGLELGVEPDRRLDVGEGNENLHLEGSEKAGTLRRSFTW